MTAHESQFIRIGRTRISLASIRAVEEPASPDGDVIIHYVGGHVEPVCKEDGEALLEWADGALMKTPKADAKRAEREKAAEKEKADKEEAEKLKAATEEVAAAKAREKADKEAAEIKTAAEHKVKADAAAKAKAEHAPQHGKAHA